MALEARSDAKSGLRSMIFSCCLIGVVVQTVDADKCCTVAKVGLRRWVCGGNPPKSAV
jgi:hypothetical protein